MEPAVAHRILGGSAADHVYLCFGSQGKKGLDVAAGTDWGDADVVLGVADVAFAAFDGF